MSDQLEPAGTYNEVERVARLLHAAFLRWHDYEYDPERDGRVGPGTVPYPALSANLKAAYRAVARAVIADRTVVELVAAIKH